MITLDELDSLILVAMHDEHASVPVIKSYTEFIGAKKVHQSLLAIVGLFKKSLTRLTKIQKKLTKLATKKVKSDSLAEIIVSNDDLASLANTIPVIEDCIKFYTEESNRLASAIGKYRRCKLN